MGNCSCAFYKDRIICAEERAEALYFFSTTARLIRIRGVSIILNPASRAYANISSKRERLTCSLGSAIRNAPRRFQDRVDLIEEAPRVIHLMDHPERESKIRLFVDVQGILFRPIVAV